MEPENAETPALDLVFFFSIIIHAIEPQCSHCVLVAVDEGTKYTILVYCDPFCEQFFTIINFHEDDLI